MGVAVFCLVAMFVFLYRTRIGRQVQAVMQNRSMASCWEFRRAVLMRWRLPLVPVWRALLVALHTAFSVDSNLGTKYIIDSFMVVVLGGLVVWRARCWAPSVWVR
jgi:urea transport system permease protein